MGQYKRKHDGPPVRELRQKDQDPARVPPHKKPRTYVLTVEWTQQRTVRKVVKAPSKAAREQMRKKIEADLAARKGHGLYFYGWLGDEVLNEIKAGPTFTESMEE